MSRALQKAQEALEANKGLTNPRYRPGYHLSAPVGWLNDPNGFGVFQGRVHLFYQFHPFDSVWGPMHWGHWTSGDFVHWREEPVALAPDEAYDAEGCFSGTSVVRNGKLCLIYTGVSRPAGAPEAFQQQCLAESADGVHFVKAPSNPVIGRELLPQGALPQDFRDPKVERMGEGYRVIAASRREAGGQLLAFRSEDLRNWRYEGIYMDGLGAMCECPDVFKLGEQTVAIVCLMEADEARYPVRQPVVYTVGTEAADALIPAAPLRMVDWGLDFYAPQTVETPDGRRVLIGWAQSWGHVMPTHTLGHGWSGLMTLPRECTLENGALCQRPARELKALRASEVSLPQMTVSEEVRLAQCAGAKRELELTVDVSRAEVFSLRLMKTGDEYFEVSCDSRIAKLRVDRSRCGHPPTGDGAAEKKPWAEAPVALQDGKLHLHIFVDVCVVEVFAGDGKTVLTSLAFPEGEAYAVSAAAKGLARIESGSCWALDA